MNSDHQSMQARAWLAVLMICLVCPVRPGIAGEGENSHESADYNRDVRPILSKFCFSCHGFDENARKAGLRLDVADSAMGLAESGARAIVPMKPDDSELIRRVTSSDPGHRMPPAETGKTLSDSQIRILRQWIEEKAPYAKHWAFERPHASKPSGVKQQGWAKSSIDTFVLNRLEKEQLQPSAEADPTRLLRRVSLDLIGLPPTIDELDDYLQQVKQDPEQAYLNAVDRLLASPHFGERMAIDWLDAARYADTNGFYGDKPRQAWPWRDWVIAALNANMPFDQFTIEQLAGDLLPNPTRSQRVATGFHRNAMANNELGIIDEEFRVEAVADRVETTGTVWLGMTLGCAQCHDHKFDPVSQHEYYQMFAYFNNSVESGMIATDSPPPTLELPSAEQEIERIRRQKRFSESKRSFAEVSKSLEGNIETWRKTALADLTPPIQNPIIACDFDSPMEAMQSVGTEINKERGIRGDAGRFDATQHIEIPSDFDADRPWTISVWFKAESALGCLFSKIEPTDGRKGIEVLWMKGKLFVNLIHQWGVDEITAVTAYGLPQSQWLHLMVQYDGSRKASGLRLTYNGHDVPLNARHDALTGSLQCAEPFRIGRRDAGLGFYGLLDQFVALQRLATDSEIKNGFYDERMRGILERPLEKLPSEESTFLKDHYISNLAEPSVRAAYASQEDARRSVADMRYQIPTTLIMEDRKETRKTHVLIRGQYDQLGPEVTAAVPALFPAVPEDAPPNRLTFARWLVSPDHPLTARVMVNRMWQSCFGEGLVRTPDDFGTQGEPPTHPELLDDLAVRFMERGWDMKQLLRAIVTSATYRQASSGSSDLAARDPENRLLGRGARFRLPAELIRDHALSVSGLLSTKIGGPSVRPYQPEGLWEEVSYNESQSYNQDTDDGLWRRSLYTYLKRQLPSPSQMMFDAGTREKCQTRRPRTNTPLQALVMLNDPTWVEASRVLAEHALIASSDDSERLKVMFRAVVSRLPEPHELQLLHDLLIREAGQYRGDPVAAERIVGVGAASRDSRISPSELAAWTIVAHTILNLDEVVTRR